MARNAKHLCAVVDIGLLVPVAYFQVSRAVTKELLNSRHPEGGSELHVSLEVLSSSIGTNLDAEANVLDSRLGTSESLDDENSIFFFERSESPAPRSHLSSEKIKSER